MKTLLFLNGESVSDLRERLAGENFDLIVAADGGALMATALGFVPNVVVGDFDSLPEEASQLLEGRGVELIRYPRDKDETDLELAVRHAVEQGSKSLRVVGAFGGRLDQEFSNVLFLSQIPIEVVILGERSEARFVKAGEDVTVPGTAGDILSLIVLEGPALVTELTGVRWELKNRSLPFGSALTVSNEFTSQPARLKIASGNLLVVRISKAD